MNGAYSTAFAELPSPAFAETVTCLTRSAQPYFRRFADKLCQANGARFTYGALDVLPEKNHTVS